MLRGMSRSALSSKGRMLRHPGDLEWLERRRMQAADLFAQGKSKAEVARWVAEEWPRIKQTPKRAGPGSASSTSRASS
jgi:hypothetical protein